MDDERERAVRERAYRIWQERGEEPGMSEEHWRRAERELDGGPDRRDGDEDVTRMRDPHAGERAAPSRDPSGGSNEQTSSARRVP